VRDLGSRVWLPLCLDVLALDGELISEAITFCWVELARFRLPARLRGMSHGARGYRSERRSLLYSWLSVSWSEAATRLG
jgi:hypothetical protein